MPIVVGTKGRTYDAALTILAGQQLMAVFGAKCDSAVFDLFTDVRQPDAELSRVYDVLAARFSDHKTKMALEITTADPCWPQFLKWAPASISCELYRAGAHVGTLSDSSSSVYIVDHEDESIRTALRSLPEAYGPVRRIDG